MNILHTEAATGWGGQEIRVLQEGRKVAEKGHKVIIACQPDGILAEKCKKETTANLDFMPVKMKRTLDIKAFFEISRIIKEKKIDIVHTHSSIDSWIGSFAGRLCGSKVVRGRHLSIPIKNFFPKYIVYSAMPDKIITSGSMIAGVVKQIKNVDPDKIVSIPTGADFSKFDFRLDKNTIRREFAVDDKTPLIGKIAVLRSWKGHNYFLDAVSLILRKYPDAKFLIVGDGPQYENIRKKIADDGLGKSVITTGHRQDIPQIMAALDIMVMASTGNEGVPQVIPQGFAMQKPIVATDAGGISEVIKDQDTGLLVPPGDSKSLAEAVISLLDKPVGFRKTLAKNGYNYAVENLSEKKMIDGILNVYEEILRR